MRKNSDTLYDRMIETFAQKTSTQWAEILEPLDISFEILARNWEVSQDPQVWANGCLTHMDCPNGSTYIVPNTPVEFSGAERAQTRHAGTLGCDTREVLTSLGYTPEQMEDLQEKGRKAALAVLTVPVSVFCCASAWVYTLLAMK